MKRSTNGLFGLSTASSAATILPSPIGLASAIASRREEIQMAINFFVANIAVVKMGGRYPAPFAAKATHCTGRRPMQSSDPKGYGMVPRSDFERIVAKKRRASRFAKRTFGFRRSSLAI